jgi:pSer/pThr/pTyr-binding forkhead associated (FHA) protein
MNWSVDFGAEWLTSFMGNEARHDLIPGTIAMAQQPRPGQPNPPAERFGTLIENPANLPGRQPPRFQLPERSGTLIETDEEVRDALLSSLKGQPQSPPAAAGPVAPSRPNLASVAAIFRPTVRAPVAVLTVYDDGKTDGEIIRIRSPRFVIGRTEGDLKIPIDGRMSSCHVEITLQAAGGVNRWVITDLQSTHGMFVRVSRTVLADRAEFLVGNGRYRFDSPQAQADSEATTEYSPDSKLSGETQGWADGASPFRPPAVTELVGNEIGNRILLVKPEYWIGSDATCPICRPDDPFCEPRHVRLFRAPSGAWHAEHNKTQNGLWLRMSQIVVDSVVRFQTGEQRFQLKVS